MKRIGRWLRANAEPTFALAIAIVFSALGVLDVLGSDNSIINAAVLLTLALLAATLLRDRASVDQALAAIAMVRSVSGPELSQAYAASTAPIPCGSARRRPPRRSAGSSWRSASTCPAPSANATSPRSSVRRWPTGPPPGDRRGHPAMTKSAATLAARDVRARACLSNIGGW